MHPFETAPLPALAQVDLVLTDVDDTITHGGRLEGGPLDAMARLQAAGVKVVPCTAAPAGWASLMANMWPVDAVIAENGGMLFETDPVRRSFPHGAPEAVALARIQRRLMGAFPWLQSADDQPYREASLAFRRLDDPAAEEAVLAALPALGASGTINSLWLLAWPGTYNKLATARTVLASRFGIDIDAEHGRVLYVGDSENDQPMFRHFPLSVGVSTVSHHPLVDWPTWVTKGPGGTGFVETAERLIAARGR
jgi:hydroxymethylpyrimidine pyrophosphatase-like HAD family hydrolase